MRLKSKFENCRLRSSLFYTAKGRDTAVSLASVSAATACNTPHTAKIAEGQETPFSRRLV